MVFLPKLHAVLANAPAAYQTYLDNFELFETATTLSPLEQQVVFQTSNYENNCHYCMPGHIYIMKASGQRFTTKLIAFVSCDIVQTA